VNLKSAIVMNEAQFPEFIHKKIDPGSIDLISLLRSLFPSALCLAAFNTPSYTQSILKIA